MWLAVNLEGGRLGVLKGQPNAHANHPCVICAIIMCVHYIHALLFFLNNICARMYNLHGLFGLEGPTYIRFFFSLALPRVARAGGWFLPSDNSHREKRRNKQNPQRPKQVWRPPEATIVITVSCLAMGNEQSPTKSHPLLVVSFEDPAPGRIIPTHSSRSKLFQHC